MWGAELNWTYSNIPPLLFEFHKVQRPIESQFSCIVYHFEIVRSSTSTGVPSRDVDRFQIVVAAGWWMVESRNCFDPTNFKLMRFRPFGGQQHKLSHASHCQAVTVISSKLAKQLSSCCNCNLSLSQAPYLQNTTMIILSRGEHMNYNYNYYGMVSGVGWEQPIRPYQCYWNQVVWDFPVAKSHHT